jgi:mRNA interferase RelE/StbE
MLAKAKKLLKSSLMKFELGFLEEALKEWRKLDNTMREQFKAKLEERLQAP